jgi:hypothetical protein
LWLQWTDLCWKKLASTLVVEMVHIELSLLPGCSDSIRFQGLQSLEANGIAGFAPALVALLLELLLDQCSMLRKQRNHLENLSQPTGYRVGQSRILSPKAKVVASSFASVRCS